MCWYCGSPVTEREPFGRSLTCPDCRKDVRCCRNCRFYLPGSRGDCAEAGAEPPGDKERANFCDWFSLDPKYRERTGGAKAGTAAGRSAFDRLFD
ncbi:MAG: hypothetical protein FWD94_00725 [Treponema sp.]|nr:hypothetical protein [Treponema sp.]